MHYYEELGIEPTASEDEIRRAHRRLTKLVHPDQQTDESLKSLAEVQMRRLNLIVETLLDPERRRAYDQHLRDGSLSFPPLGANIRPEPVQKRALRSLPWWLASTAGAILLTIVVVWFGAEHWGSSFTNRNPVYISSVGSDTTSTAAPGDAIGVPGSPETQPNRVSSPPPASVVPRIGVSARSVPLPTVSASDHGLIKPTPLNPTALQTNSRRFLSLPANVAPPALARNEVSVPPAPRVTLPPPHPEITAPVAAVSASLPPAPKPIEPAPAPNPNEAAPAADDLAGEWVYAPTEPEQRKTGLYPPEYIDLRLIRADGRLTGQYKARYRVTDRPIPPDVSFALASDSTGRKFQWQSSNGSRGTFTISSIDASTIRVEWRTTVFSRGPALTAGTATLVRRP